MSEGSKRALRVMAALGGGGALMFVGCVGLCVGFPCFTTGFRYGLWSSECPAGTLRLDPTLELEGVRRGEVSGIRVRPDVRWARSEEGEVRVDHGRLKRGYDVRLALLDAKGEAVEGLGLVEADRDRGGWLAKVKLGDLPDGDYRVRATIDAPFEQQTVEVPLPLYVPAVIHVVSDRPLYKPGQEVLFRAALLDRAQLAPLPGRPGTWTVRDPSGEVMHRERVIAGPWGVVASSFPLADDAAEGIWKVSFESGGSADTIDFEVRPFQLPRLVATLEATQPWYAMGDALSARGEARTSAGAPLAFARVEAGLRRTSGRWTPPIAWEAPIVAQTDAQGRFTLELGKVPSDLVGLSELNLAVRVASADGETVAAGARLVLSEHALLAEAVTELGDGLVGGFNNRVWLRITSPAGAPLPDTDVRVTNAWEPGARPRVARTDADGVLALQLDPGKPASVVEPSVPGRYRKIEPPMPRLVEATEVTTGAGLDLAERRAIDATLLAVRACGDLVQGNERAQLGLRVGADGLVRDALGDATPVGACVLAATRGLRFPAGEERTYRLAWEVPDSQRPSLAVQVASAHGPDHLASNALREAALRARSCFPHEAGQSGEVFGRLAWRVRPGSDRVEVSFADAGGQAGLSADQAACARRAFAETKLASVAQEGALGTASLHLQVPRGQEVGGAAASVRTAYELRVAAEVDGEARTGRLVVPVGQVPPLRLRPSSSLLKPGDTLTVELIRGPGWSGELPKKLRLWQGPRELAEAEVDAKARSVSFTLPPDARGFVHVEHAGARAIVLVQPADRLALSLAPERPVYRPGEQAHLLVKTTAGERPVGAAVSLIGVDSQLSQLAILTAPDDFGRVTVEAKADNPAFGRFDARMLALGQIRGEQAAQAAMLRISQLPSIFPGDQAVYGNASTVPKDQEVLLWSFYRGLTALQERVRTWEAGAKEGEVLDAKLVVAWWEEGLREARRSGEPIADIWGLDLHLTRLPRDLVEQVDPRRLVSDATRLPEDSVSWTDFVAGRAR